MPFIAGTPESLLGRSDSKDPGTTCRGVTGSGRPCRRSLLPSTTPSPAGSRAPSQAPSPAPSPAASPAPGKSKGRVAQLQADDPSSPDAYCWQHREQASSSAKPSPGPRPSQTPVLDGRASLDTLMDRLGIVEAQQKKHRKRRTQKQDGTSGKTHARPSQAGHGAAGDGGDNDHSYNSQEKDTAQRSSFSCCCFTLPAMEEEEPPARPRPVPVQSAPAKLPGGRRSSGQHLSPPLPVSGRPSGASKRKSSAQSATSQTAQYLNLIPPTASPQTASLLMAELAKPISQQDEAGYIYIFWLTPESQPSTPAAEAASVLLSPSIRAPPGKRRASDVLDDFASKATRTGANGKKTILLKIGRANNVQRRLNEWTRQCGYNLSLIRYYPYIPSNRPSTPRKVPHSHKVERLVHIELAGAGLRVSDRENCESCGKAHREWFEVGASRQSVMVVDEIVRRWADWDETATNG
ncbi:GIY-YIG nuclease family protein [Microdochium nivale]|nr:GIY-YIG nuclease family protein [Microdochium nivale]